ncbi:ATP-binding protein [Ideonella sp. YS5]|uniref:ATP-binding protein n=1 Tax=Ideonella sp. YS5 TaxID=3453714 RepID=UPI003EEE1FF8
MSCHLRLIGTPSAQAGADRLPLPFERRWQLVALLALQGDWMQRAELAAILWPDVPRSLASTNLRKALFRLSGTPCADAIESDGPLLRSVASTDLQAFHEQVREGRLAEALQQAPADLLAGFDDDANESWTQWLNGQRERWRRAWRGAALQRLQAGIPDDEAIALSAAMLEADALDEAALDAHVRHLAHAGQAARARQAWRTFAQRLEQDLGVQPGSALRALHDSLLSPVPATAAPEARDDGYVGRVAELRRIGELMARPACRLLAIVGPGGIGKTRLARRAMDEVSPLFDDGAVFVPLEDVDSAAAFVARLCRLLGVPRLRTGDEFESLAGHLRERRLLLVLDNFEPIASMATPLIERLLEAAPGLKLIVTTRERLVLAAQWALPLEGLPCPEPEDMDRLEAFDASRLFLAAARRADPASDAAGEPATIVDICRQVDGLPLALELTAAWTRLMRCADIARELREGTELLRATNPAFPARQASLEAVFEQSWRLLGERERQALARLSAFRGGFTVDAARVVAAAPLPVLGALLDKSLLRKEGTRMTLHPLVQQFAALRLGDDAAYVAARVAHALFFREVLAERQVALRGGDAEALRCIDDEFENCRVALEWLSKHGPGERLATAAWGLSDYAEHRGQPQRALVVLQAALAAPVAAREPTLRSRLLVHAAHLQLRLDRFAQAETEAREALAAASQGDANEATHTRRMAWRVLGASALRLGRLDEAREHFQAMLELASGPSATRDRAVSLDHLSLIERRVGRHDEALRLSRESLVLQRRQGDVAVLSLGLNNLGSLHLDRGEPEAAEAPLTEALALCERSGLSATAGLVLANLSDMALMRSDLASAQHHARRALELVQPTGQRLLLGWLHAQLGIVAALRGEVASASASVSAACEIALGLQAPLLKAKATVAFAQLVYRLGHAVAARQALRIASAEPSLSAGDREELARPLAQWSEVEDTALPALPAIDLDGLLQRATVEASGGFVSLVASLGG